MNNSCDTVLGTRRGSGRYTDEPRFLDAPASDCADVPTLAEFDRRLRIGVFGALDEFDELGRVSRRVIGTVSRLPQAHAQSFEVKADDGTRVSAARARRSTPPEVVGPTWEYRYAGEVLWRFTFLAEEDAQETPPRPRRRPARGPYGGTLLTRRRVPLLSGGQRLTSWRYWPLDNPGDPVFAWTTERVDGGYLSLVLLPTDGHADPEGTYDVVASAVRRHEMSEGARERVSRFRSAWRTTGERGW